MAERRGRRLALGLLVAAAGCKPTWPRYEAPDGSFSAELPPPLRVEAERIEGNQRLLSIESRSTEDQAFLVQRRRPAPGRRLDPQGVLDGFCAEFARARSYQIAADARGTRSDGRPAQTCAFHAQGLEIRIQVLAAGQCVYTLMAMWRGAAPDVDRFLDGFRVAKDCEVDERP
ncbi:MAG TPA: hypothetical protein VMT11_19385 [Myxococcaceae bacterium]|nr:hypothetical protein [Myxococcaceae bacterium]